MEIVKKLKCTEKLDISGGPRKRYGALGLAVAGLIAACVPGRTQAAPPNVVLIMADDLGAECLGCYGSASYKTPVLDRLAETGVLFRNCHAQPLCTPSRVKIMTGKYNFRNYAGFATLKAGETTFAHLAREAGYATCIAGKWQLGGQKESLKAFGFDEYCLWQLFSYPVKDRGPRYADPVVWRNGEKEVWNGKYGPDVFSEFVVDFIERKKDQPFFVYYPMVLAHDPFVPTPTSPEWEMNRTGQSTRYFKDMVEYTDHVVGRILKKLDDLDLREDTLILFAGDNGTHVGIESKMKDGRVVRGGKGYTTDNGTHVPLIANWTGVAAAGQVCDDLISFNDFLPTVAQVVEAVAPENMDGVSFLPQIKGEKGCSRDWLYMYASLQHPWVKKGGLGDWVSGPGAVTIEPDSLAGGWETYVKQFARDKRWKLYSTGHLYDLSNDLFEKVPVLPGQDTPESAEARKYLESILRSVRSDQRK
jgi:arylsulfatase A